MAHRRPLMYLNDAHASSGYLKMFSVICVDKGGENERLICVGEPGLHEKYAAGVKIGGKPLPPLEGFLGKFISNHAV